MCCKLRTHGKIPNSKVIVNMTLIETWMNILYLMFLFQVNRTKSSVLSFLCANFVYLLAYIDYCLLIISTVTKHQFQFLLANWKYSSYLYFVCVHFDFVMITSFAHCFIVSCKSFSLNSTTF